MERYRKLPCSKTVDANSRTVWPLSKFCDLQSMDDGFLENYEQFKSRYTTEKPTPK